MDKFESSLGRSQRHDVITPEVAARVARMKHVREHPEVVKIDKQISELTKGEETPEGRKKYDAMVAKQKEVKDRVGKEHDAKLKKVADSGGFGKPGGATSESTLPGKSKDEEYERASRQRDADDTLATQQGERSLKAGERKEKEAKSTETGPRGGKFYVNAAGTKVYVK